MTSYRLHWSVYIIEFWVLIFRSISICLAISLNIFLQDTKLLYQQISKPMGLVRVPFDKFNHVDFLWAKDINKLLNDELIEFVKNSTDFYYGSDFIQANVLQALDIRAKTPAPVDVPFNEGSFFNKIQNKFTSMSGLGAVDFAKYPVMAHKQIVQSLDQAKSGKSAFLSEEIQR